MFLCDRKVAADDAPSLAIPERCGLDPEPFSLQCTIARCPEGKDAGILVQMGLYPTAVVLWTLC